MWKPKEIIINEKVENDPVLFTYYYFNLRNKLATVLPSITLSPS